MVRYVIMLMIMNQINSVHGQSTSNNTTASNLSLGVKGGFVHSTMDPHGSALTHYHFSTNGYKAGLEVGLRLPKSKHWSFLYELGYLRAVFQNHKKEVHDNGVTKWTKLTRFDADVSSLLQKLGVRYLIAQQRPISPYVSAGAYHSLIFNKDISSKWSFTIDPPEPGYPDVFYGVSKIRGPNDFGTFFGFGMQKKKKGAVPAFNFEIQWSKSFGLETNVVEVGRSDSSTGSEPLSYLVKEKVVSFHANYYALEMTFFIL